MRFHCVQYIILKNKFIFLVLQSSGPPKKGKPASAPAGKGKKGLETKEVIETELSVSMEF